MIDDEEFAAEVEADLAVERRLFWCGLLSVGAVVVMLVLRQAFFV